MQANKASCFRVVETYDFNILRRRLRSARSSSPCMNTKSDMKESEHEAVRYHYMRADCKVSCLNEYERRRKGHFRFEWNAADGTMCGQDGLRQGLRKEILCCNMEKGTLGGTTELFPGYCERGNAREKVALLVIRKDRHILMPDIVSKDAITKKTDRGRRLIRADIGCSSICMLIV